MTMTYELLTPPRAFWAAVISITLTGCGNLVAGGIGEVVVEVSGDAADPLPAPIGIRTAPAVVAESTTGSVTAESDSPPAGSDHDDDDPEGQLEAKLRLFLVSANGSSIELAADEIEVRVDLEGIEQDEIANRVVAAGNYTELRLVFSEIRARVDAGLTINGVPFTGPVDVDLDDPLPVSRVLDLEVRPDQRATVLIDLNATGWLQAVDPVTGLVDPRVFADLVSIVLR